MSHSLNIFVVLDDRGSDRELAKADKLVVNISGTGGRRFMVCRLNLVAVAPDLFEQIVEKRLRLIDVAEGVLSAKTLDEINQPGFRNRVRVELTSAFNSALNFNWIGEVIITELVIQ